MSQQINLFNPVFRQQKKHFSTVAMLQSLLLLGTGGLVLAAFLSYRISSLEQSAEAGKQQLAAREVQLAKVDQQFAPRLKSKDLALEVVAAEAELKTLQEAKDVLQRGEFGNARGYSAYFRGFARQRLVGLWLTRVTILRSGEDIGIEGRALRAELVPQYIRRLASEPVFYGKSFVSLEISQAGELNALPGAPGSLPALLAFKLQAAPSESESAPGGAAR